MRQMLDIAALGAGALFGRNLQEMMIPDYTSPPTEIALAATPKAFRDDSVIDAGRAADANGTCFSDSEVSCHIPFFPPQAALDSGTVKLGVIHYGGGLVDPRAYSPVAKMLSERYGFAVVIPIFANDLAFQAGRCDTERLTLASKEFPFVEKWILAGHSLGGIAANVDAWTHMNNNNDTTALLVGGLALLGSYIIRNVGCGEIDFSSTNMPTALVNASLDTIVNATNFDLGLSLLPVNDTFYMEILGGNHAQFGSYDYAEREELFGQVDGNATIHESVQQDLVVGAIAHVASRTGIPLPTWEREDDESAGSTSGSHKRWEMGWILVVSGSVAACLCLM